MIRLSVQRFGLLVPALAVALCAGCPPAPEPSGAENRQGRLDALDQEAAEGAANAREREDVVARDRGEETVLAFDRIELTPDAASVRTEQFQARAYLQPGASAFTEIEFKWTVGDRELTAHRLGKLRKNEGDWKALDWIKVQAVATDETGRTAFSDPVAVQIANGSPTITTDLSKVKFLSGLKLKATDPDNDPITWSVEGDPPGVSITDSGVIRVRAEQLTEGFEGEAVFVAEDPHGARHEIHIPLSINAAQDARTEDAGVDVREADTRKLTDAELVKQAEDDAKLMESLSEAEMQKLLKEREAARNQ